jgi:hypothetical protein
MTHWFTRTFIAAAVAIAVSACAQLVDVPTPDNGVIIITAGSTAPDAIGAATTRRLSNLEEAEPSVGGSASAPVSVPGLGCTTDDYQPVDLVISYTVSGSQARAASFDVNTVWTFDGTSFVGSSPVTVNVPAASGAPRTYTVDISLENAGLLGSGATTVTVEPFNLVNDPATTQPGQRLSFDESSTATIYVQFDDCASENTPPSLTLPPNLTVEATSSSGAAVDFVVLGSDNEDGALTPTCLVGAANVNSGDQFPIGTSEVTCSVTDSGGLTTTGNFFIYVQDTTAPVFTEFPEDTTLVATDINGLTLDLSAFGIAAKDFGPLGESAGEVSPPVSVTCTIDDDPADGFQIEIGQTATVTCVATDTASYRAPVDEGETAPPAPNVSEPSSLDVTVTLQVSDTCGFEPPLRMAAPYSAHKTNSTIPHKFCPPAYADGTPATDLASGLRLVLTLIGSNPADDAIEANDFAAGSTEWRFDDGHYIFNLKTARAWAPGQYDTTVSYNDIVLASTEFALRK